MDFSRVPDFAPIDFEAALNEEQYAAVTAPEGPALVLAGAGSGKTRTLTYRVAWLLEQGLRPWEILLLTFTNKSAQEMLERVEELTGVGARELWGGTFHSIGQRILRTEAEALGLERSFTIMDAGDADALFGEIVRTVDASFTKKKENPKPRALGDLFSYARNTRRPVTEVAAERYPWLETLPGLMESFSTRYTKAKRERQVCDFDDLLELWRDLMHHHEQPAEKYQRRFRAILVDEYQDTNLLQSEIIDRIATRHQIMAVGDDAQCIYTWRGANFENIANFPERHPGTRIFKIETNYRSAPEILDLANGVLAHQPVGAGYHKELRAVRESHGKPVVASTLDSKGQAQFVIQMIERLVDAGYAMSEMGILYRAHFQALDLQLELSRRGVPFIITSGVKFFEQAHVRDLSALLRFVANPYDSPAFQRLAALLPKIGARTAERLFARYHELLPQQEEADAQAKAEAQTGKGASPKEMDLFASDEASPSPAKKPPKGKQTAKYVELPGLAPELTHSRFAPLLEERLVTKVPAAAREDWIAMAASIAEADLKLRGSRVSRAGVLHEPATPDEIVESVVEGWYGDFLRTLHTNWQSRLDDLQSLAEFASRYDNLTDFLSQLVLLNSESSERDTGLGEESLRLTTIHQAKGLEYPIVFVIGLADGMFPLRRAIEEGDLDEERRLFYVAVTRARDRLFLTYPMLGTQNGGAIRQEASRFLQGLNPEHYELVQAGRMRW